MKKLFKLSIYIIFIMTVKSGFAQQENSYSNVSNVLKLNFLLPGFSYELEIGKYETIYLSSYLGALITRASESANNQPHIFLTPSFNAEYRNYYNINNRKRKDLRTEINSANYIAPLYVGKYSKTSYYSDSRWINQIGIVWGLQRNSPKGFSADVSFGAVYTFNSEHLSYYKSLEPLIQIELGFWLGRKFR